MIFTLVLWCIGALIYLSGRNSKVNRWCAGCFFITSIGVLKEFLMDNAVPVLTDIFPWIPAETYMTVNSILTAVLYLGTPFCFITLAMYFYRLDERKPKILRGIQIWTLFLILLFLFFFSPLQFKKYQLTSFPFWCSMSVYNLGYAAVGTAVIIKGVLNERKESVRKRKKLLAEIMLPPYYWWLGTIFVIHTLRMQAYMKVWRANLYLSLALLLYYLYIALREGMMGIQFCVVVNPWDSDIQAVDKSTHYINHMIKNQAVKIDWCVDILRRKFKGEGQKELDIIENASRQLQEFTSRTTRFLNTAVHDSEPVRVSFLLEEVLREWKTVFQEIDVELEYKQDVVLFCDVVNVKEVIQNLLENAKDAMDQSGEIKISTGFDRMRRNYFIKISDSGKGMDDKVKKEVFSPYFTTKKTGVHYGLGLAFCQSIMRAHGGKIRINSMIEKGTEVALCFPRRRVQKL